MCALEKESRGAEESKSDFAQKGFVFFDRFFSPLVPSDDPRTNPKVETRAPHGRTNLDCTEEGRRENDTAAPRARGAYGATSRAAARGRADRADEQ